MSKINKKKHRIHEGNPIATVLIYAVCILAALICVYPMWYVFCMSLSDAWAVEARKVWWYPVGFSIHGYKVITAKVDMWRAYGNTIIYVIGSVLMMLTTCLLAGYPLTVKSMIGRKPITTFFLIPMYFGAGLIPTFLRYQSYGFVDNPLTLIITHGFSIWYMILTRTYLLSIPESLRDSAKVDGASHFRTLFQIFMPLSKPIIAVMVLYFGISHWNDFMTPLIYLKTRELWPLQLFLKEILIQSQVSSEMGLDDSGVEFAMQMQRIAQMVKYTTIVVSSLPMLVIYPFLQKYFVKGVMIGAVKG